MEEEEDRGPRRSINEDAARGDTEDSHCCSVHHLLSSNASASPRLAVPVLLAPQSPIQSATPNKLRPASSAGTALSLCLRPED